MKYKKETYIAIISAFLICIYVASDFLRILGFAKLYFTMVPVAVVFSVIGLLICVKVILLDKNNFIYILSLILCICLCIIEYINNGLENQFIILQNSAVILLPLVFIVTNKGFFKVKMIAYTYIVFNTLIALPSVLNHFIALPTATTAGPIGRDSGFYINPNINGMANAISVVLLIWCFAKSKKTFFNLEKVFIILEILISLASILLSGCRSAILSLLAIMLMIILFKIKNLFIRISVVLAGIVSSLIIVMFRYKKSNILSLDIEMFLEIISSQRYSLWKESFILLDGHYLLGRGYNCISKYVDSYIEITTTGLVNKSYVNFHNVLIDILIFSGIIPLILFILLGITYIYRIVKKHNKDIYAVCIVICGFIISLFDVSLLYSACVINMVWWLFLYYSASENKYIKTTKN